MNWCCTESPSPGEDATSAEPQKSTTRHFSVFCSLLSTYCRSVDTHIKQTKHPRGGGEQKLLVHRHELLRLTGPSGGAGRVTQIKPFYVPASRALSKTITWTCEWLHVSPLLQEREVSLIANMKNFLNPPTFMLPSFLNTSLTVVNST